MRLPKKETVEMRLTFEIEYDASIAGARGSVIGKIQPFFEKSGHGWSVGEWAIRQKNKRFINEVGF